MKRSTIGLQAMAGLSLKMLRHPWIAGRLAGLQTAKYLFNAFNVRGDEGRGHKIRQLSLRVTDRCNLRCTTCGQWGEGGFMHGKNLEQCFREEVSAERYIDMIRDLYGHGHRPVVYLWGGEPMLYKGTPDIIAAAAALHLPVAIATNGTRIAAAAQRLVAAPLFLLQISIDGHCAELHNRLRPSGSGKSGNFAAIEEGLAAVHEKRRLQGRSLPFIAALTTVSRDNANHLVDIYNAFCDRVDFFIYYLSWWIDEDSAQKHEEDFSRRFGFAPRLHRGWIGGWKPDDYAALDEEIQRLRRKPSSLSSPPVILMPFISGIDDLRRYYTDHACTFGFNQCISIYQAAEIDSNGDVSPCRDYHDYVAGSIKDHYLTEIWNSPAYRSFRKSLSQDGLMPVCTRCCGLMGY